LDEGIAASDFTRVFSDAGGRAKITGCINYDTMHVLRTAENIGLISNDMVLFELG